jgi:hypothetical protein
MLAIKTTMCSNAIVTGVKEQSPFRHFVDAVHALSERPDPQNVARYLAASRAIEEDRTRATHADMSGEIEMLDAREAVDT